MMATLDEPFALSRDETLALWYFAAQCHGARQGMTTDAAVDEIAYHGGLAIAHGMMHNDPAALVRHLCECVGDVRPAPTAPAALRRGVEWLLEMRDRCQRANVWTPHSGR